MEQSRFELVTKAISRISFETNPRDARTHSTILKNDNIDEITSNALANYTMQIAQNEIIKEGTFSLSVKDIETYLKEYVAETKEKPFVVIDYLQIIAPSDTKLSDKQQIDHNITTLKRLSRDLDIPIFAISSFNRGNYSQTAGFEAFKESGRNRIHGGRSFYYAINLIKSKRGFITRRDKRS